MNKKRAFIVAVIAVAISVAAWVIALTVIDALSGQE